MEVVLGEGIVLKELIGQLLIGAGGAGGAVLLVLIFLCFKLDGNSKKIKDVEEECKEHRAIIDKQDKLLVKIDTNQKNMMETQKKIFDKLDKLYDYHVNGGKGK